MWNCSMQMSADTSEMLRFFELNKQGVCFFLHHHHFVLFLLILQWNYFSFFFDLSFGLAHGMCAIEYGLMLRDISAYEKYNIWSFWA